MSLINEPVTVQIGDESSIVVPAELAAELAVMNALAIARILRGGKWNKLDLAEDLEGMASVLSLALEQTESPASLVV